MRALFSYKRSENDRSRCHGLKRRARRRKMSQRDRDELFILQESFGRLTPAHRVASSSQDVECCPVKKQHNIIHWKISQKTKEIIVILDSSNNGKKKEVR